MPINVGYHATKYTQVEYRKVGSINYLEIRDSMNGDFIQIHLTDQPALRAEILNVLSETPK